MPTSVQSKPNFAISRQRSLLVLPFLLVILAILLFLSPAERQLGNLVKIIYLHGALARSGMVGLMAAGLLGLAFLWRLLPALLRWSNAVQTAGMIIFAIHFVLSVIPTRATWGMWIAWDEPRTIMSLQIIGVGLIVIVVRHLLGEPRISALANLLLGGAVALLAGRTGVLRHPLDPIGGSSSANIKLFYAAILIVCLALTALLAWLIAEQGTAAAKR